MNKRIQIDGTWYEIEWHKGIEDYCEDCYDWGRYEHVGDLRNMKVYKMYAHGDAYYIEYYYHEDGDGGSYTTGIAGTPTKKCDYAEEE